ncbi:MAG TPA: nuclear transport factor 2 family protein [Bauldia sp.]|nr:nuclear transport factor 2 family protein [Bauldia sp.]
MTVALAPVAGIPLPGIDVASVVAAEAGPDAATVTAALEGWWGALVKGTPEAVAPVLAPEFQMMRADGSGYDRDGYLGSALPKVAAIPEFSRVVATQQGDTLVVRYYVTVNETRDGKTVQRHAPRITVFRKDGDAWLVVAHGNFALLEK